MRHLHVFCLILAVTASAAADDVQLGEARAKALAPYLDDTTFLVLRVDVTKLDFDEVGNLVPVPDSVKKNVAQMKDRFKQLQELFLTAGGKQVYLTINLHAVQGQGSPLLIAPTKNAAAAEKLVVTIMKLAGERGEFGLTAKGATVLGGDKRTIARVGKADAAARPDLAKSLAQSADKPIQVVLAPPEIVRKSIEEAAPKLPIEVGGGSIRVLTRGLRWASLHLVPKPKGEMQWIVQCADEASAKALEGLARKTLALVTKDGQPERETWRAIIVALLQQRKRVGDRLVVTIDSEQFTKLVADAANHVQRANDVMISMNNLKMIGLAMHGYHDTHGRLPAPHSTNAQNKPLLSWRVHVLPYLEQQELYKQFKLDEPWDSDHNKKLIAKMPEVYATPFHPKLAKAGKTTLLVPTGQETFFPDDKGIKITEAKDGTSNTILALLADEKSAQIWTKPGDWEFDAKNPAKGLAIVDKGVHIFLIGDGSVRAIPSKVDKKTLKALFTRDGREVFEIPK